MRNFVLYVWIKLTLDFMRYLPVAPQIVIWKSSSSPGSPVTKCYENSVIENLNRFEDELCLELPDKVLLSGDILITVNHKPKMQLRKVNYIITCQPVSRARSKKVCLAATRISI